MALAIDAKMSEWGNPADHTYLYHSFGRRLRALVTAHIKVGKEN